MAKALEHKEVHQKVQIANVTTANHDGGQKMMNLPRTWSLTYLLDMNYLGPILSDGSYCSAYDFGTDPFVKSQPVEMTNNYVADSGKYQGKQSSTIDQPIYVKQMYEI